MMSIDEYVTVSEAAAALKRSAGYIRTCLARTDGKGPPFRGVKRGPVWFVLREDVQSFSPRPPGRPKSRAPAEPSPSAGTGATAKKPSRAPAKARRATTDQRRKRASKKPSGASRAR